MFITTNIGKSMSGKFYQSKKFIALQNTWYKKLSQAGFSDLEWTDSKTGQGHSTPFLSPSIVSFRSSYSVTTQKYYEICRRFLQHGKFKSRLHKYVWELYCDGISYRKMIPKIKARGFKKVPSIFWISVKVNEMYADATRFNYQDLEKLAEDPEQIQLDKQKELVQTIQSNKTFIV